MFYFIETEGNKIVSKSESSQSFELPEGYREIEGSLYDSIGAMPCSFSEVDGETVSIEFIEPIPVIQPTPEPTPIETLRLEQAQSNVEMIDLIMAMLGGV